MVDEQIEFPIIELTDWVFDCEKVLSGDLSWDGIHYIKEKDFNKQYERILVDSNGEILKVSGKKIIGKKGILFSFIIHPNLVVEFNLEKTGRIMSLEDLKRKNTFKKC